MAKQFFAEAIHNNSMLYSAEARSGVIKKQLARLEVVDTFKTDWWTLQISH